MVSLEYKKKVKRLAEITKEARYLRQWIINYLKQLKISKHDSN